MLASVIIPTKNRTDVLVRAIKSVINSKNSDVAEIIIVDDNSDEKLSLDCLRSQDKIIYLETSSGAAVARNKGIDEAKGKVIFLLDSDDYYVERDFFRDSQFALSTPALCYSEIKSQLFESNFPTQLTTDDFLESILFKNKHIGQTSSLYFNQDLNLKFDETLPKHQDWDFILFSALLSQIEVKKGSGTIYFDRGDRNSLSRIKSHVKSLPWFKKLQSSPDIYNEENKILLKFYLFAEYKEMVNFIEFISLTLKLAIKNKLKLIDFIKKAFYRFSLLVFKK
jgi:glycosyltransferase involved in cell wall biosynthesis